MAGHSSSGSKKKSSVGGGTGALAGGGAGGRGGGGGTSESARLVQHHGAGAGGGRLRSGSRGTPTGAPASGFGAAGTGVAYGSYQPLCPRSNPVEDCLRAGVAGLGWCLVSWLIGVLLLVLDYARRWGAHRRVSGEVHEHGTTWLVFAPFWVGDFLALLVLARVAAKVSTVRFVSPARGRGRRSDGRARSTGNLNDATGQGGGGGGWGWGRGGDICVDLGVLPSLAEGCGFSRWRIFAGAVASGGAGAGVLEVGEGGRGGGRAEGACDSGAFAGAGNVLHAEGGAYSHTRVAGRSHVSTSNFEYSAVDFLRL